MKPRKIDKLPRDQEQRLEAAKENLKKINEKLSTSKEPLRIIRTPTIGDWCDSTCLELLPLVRD